MKKDHQFYFDRFCSDLLQRCVTSLLALTRADGYAGELTVGIIPEFPIVSASIQKQRRLDALATIFAANEAITVALEFKDDLGDLLYDTKIPEEVGHADFFFLAVPPELLPCAICVIADQSAEIREHIGLVDLNSGNVVMHPAKTNLLAEERSKRFEEAYRQALRGNDASATIPIPKEDKAEEFVRFDRHLTNTKYLPQILAQFDKAYDYSRFRELVKNDYPRFHLSHRYADPPGARNGKDARCGK